MLFKKRLSHWSCKNQGYILDGFPSTIEQAELLFGSDDNSVVGIPDYTICIDESDDFLKQSVLGMDEHEMIEMGFDQQGFLKVLQLYRENNTEDRTVLNYFEEKESNIQIHLTASQNINDLISEIINVIGKPHNYGPSLEELETKRKIMLLQEVCYRQM